MGCNLKFHTKKEKLEHHSSFEPECRIERNSLIDLLGKYKAAIFEVAQENNISVEELEKNEDYEELVKEISNTSKKLLDPDYFCRILGLNKEDFKYNEEIMKDKDMDYMD